MEKIFAVDLKSYSKKIDSYMEQCIERAKKESARDLCLYYDIDNGWDSTYMCAKSLIAIIINGFRPKVGLELEKRGVFREFIKKRHTAHFLQMI